MKKLDYNDYYICRMQGRIFESSIEKTNCSSPVFIRRFMNSEIATSFDNKTILLSTIDINGVFDLINEEYGETSYGKTKYGANVLYWVGYIYRVMCIYYDLSSKAAYKLVSLNEIIKFYDIGHTFDPEDAVERIFEDKKNDFDYTSRGVLILKRLSLFNKLKEMIGKSITVYIDRPIGFKNDEIIYEQNYGYIKEFKALDGEYQDAYVLGVDSPLKTFTGKVIAIIQRKEDIEDKIVVCDMNKTFSKEDIEKKVSFMEKYFKHKIIM